ncbi:MAG TPA: HDIG domain-containing protein [Elusimicrobiota bacterium]|nr:HDIG domain-containing protein [Elusimicrobiota bacterium]
MIGRYLSTPLRHVLLRILSWTEKHSETPRLQRVPLLKREVRISTGWVALLVWAMLLVVLLFQFGLEWQNAVAVFLFTGMIMVLFIFYFRHDHPEILHDEEAVMLLGVLAVGSVLMIQLWFQIVRSLPWVSPFGMPLAVTSILTVLLLQPRLAIILTTVLSLLFGVIDNFSMTGTLVMFFGGLTGVARALYVRTRRDVTRAGLWVSLAQVLSILVLGFLRHWPAQNIFFALLWGAVGGVLSSFLALSLLPYLESFFSRLTNIKLLELADVNHPLLKRMSLEAPGTYHHSLIMASLAEPAAEAVGANGLLCRVGAYFHDIGKLVKPEYYVENQGALGNPHEPLPPNMSRLVIQSHVKEGMVLAQQYGLDKIIVDFVRMHHGTSRIEYFYRRAIEQSADLDDLGTEEYRYPGPKPNSRETAILMLADSVEASVRTIDSPTHQRLQDQVGKIIGTKMNDGQFDGVPLTLADLHEISESFVNTLTGIYHSRIPYPEASEEPELFPPPASNSLFRT